MRRAGISVACALATSCALVGCDAIFGIDVFSDPGSDGGTADSSVTPESGRDASQDAGTEEDVTTRTDAAPRPDGAVDAAPVQDAAPDTSDDQVLSGCAPQCAGGTSRCVGGKLQTCDDVAGCYQWSTPAACPGASACWSAGNEAYCCAGGSDVCAPSCQGLMPDAGLHQGCGPSASESCCTSLAVDGGTFLRSYDGVTHADNTNPATVSTFMLDKYEVTVSRFRKFVGAWVNGYRPAAGSGIHTHLNGGMGLADSSSPGSFEQGWNTAWASVSLDQQVDWDTALTCGDALSTWTSQPGANEGLAINCVDWASAYAFCIYDGGFLPSETEWNYAAAGGGDAQGQRVYAWSSPPSSETIDCTYGAYSPCSSQVFAPGLFTKGYGRWGQADLTGNVWEWNLDGFATYVTPCNDCAYMADNGLRAIRGAAYSYPADQLYVATRVGDDPAVRYPDDGFRCARSP